MIKKILLTLIVTMMTTVGLLAQVRIQSPHPDLKVKITRCVAAGNSVILDLVLTNYGPDEEITFYRSLDVARGTNAYDDEGNQYLYAVEVGLPNNMTSSGHNDKMINFPQEVPMKFRVQINEVNPNAAQFSLIKICGQSRGALNMSWDKPIVIKNLDINRD